MTLEEFLAWQDLPENAGRTFELVQGEVVEMSRPSVLHGHICGNLTFSLKTYVRGRKRGTVATNDSGILTQLEPPTVRGPDVALFAENLTREQMLSDSISTRVPPTLAIEVISPSETMPAILDKVGEYLNSGVSLVWTVHPEENVVSVFKRGAVPRTFRQADSLDGNGILPDLLVSVADIFELPGGGQS